VSASNQPDANSGQQGFLSEVEALVAALMGDALPAEVTSLTDQLEAAAGQGDGACPDAVNDVRNAVKLVRNGQPCAAVSALLSARLALSAPPR
jgi:hypothetical protein